MGRSQLRCRDCGHLAADGWHISKSGLCRICARERAAVLVDAGFPPDPIPCGATCHQNAGPGSPEWARVTELSRRINAS